LGQVRIYSKLFIVEEDINKIKVGQDVFIELNTDKNKSYKAILSKIYPFFDSQEQSFIAEAKFVDKIKIKIRNTTSGEYKNNEKSNALVIPTEFLLPGDLFYQK
jgi:macrolide-specific efflux system membrane fusion protein